MLEPLGLDCVCESVYVTILANPGIRPEDLAAQLSLSPSDMDSAVQQLRSLTLLQLSRTDGEGLRAVSPERGMEILLAVQEAELASFQQRVELSRAAAARLIAEHAKIDDTRDTPEIEYLSGIDAIRLRLETLSARVEAEVMNFSPTKQTETDVSAGKLATLRYAGTKVSSRTIYQHSALQDPVTADYMMWLIGHGFELRTTPALPSRMVIFDRKTGVLPMNSDDSREGAVVLYGRATVTAFCSLFDWVWDRATPLDRDLATRDAVSAAMEEEAIWLLAQGYTDETVAKRLGISPRTSRRIVESMMRRLGARSRFQAGVFAERNDMLSRSPR